MRNIPILWDSFPYFEATNHLVRTPILEFGFCGQLEMIKYPPEPAVLIGAEINVKTNASIQFLCVMVLLISQIFRVLEF